jgi:hypothetical protein
VLYTAAVPGISAGQLERLVPGTRIIEQGSNDRDITGRSRVQVADDSFGAGRSRR